MRWLALGSLSCALASTAARAQVADGVDISGPQLASITSRWFTVDGLDARGHNRWAAGSSLAWSHRPLVIWDAANPDKALFVVVQHQVFLRPGLAWMLWDRVRFEAQLPVLLVNDGGQGVVGATLYDPERGAAFGDVRLGADAFLLGEPGDALRVGAGVRVHLPTGSEAAYAGAGATRLGPIAHVAGDAGRFAYGANLALIAQPMRHRGPDIGNRASLHVAGGVRLLDEHLTVGPELSVETALVNGGSFESATTPAELMAGAHYQTESGWLVGLGLGRGIDNAIGSPDLRGQASLTWASEPTGAVAPDGDGDGFEDGLDQCMHEAALLGSEDPSRPGCALPADQDRDGLPDLSDECPTVATGNMPDVGRPGCPLPPDQDGDGVTDADDRCPDQAALGAEMDPARPGCPVPPDRDGDGVDDERDQCPDEAFLAGRLDPTRSGCPLPQDSDGDTVMDEDDACPQDPAPVASAISSKGCPAARMDQGQISIAEPIEFTAGAAEVSAKSDDVLLAVAQLLNAHPEITVLGIDGHTDTSGKSAFNRTLSDARARAVQERLVKFGVAAARLLPTGLGDTHPIASNDDEVGRAKNRRVQFVIVSRSATAPE